jgi:hypothetical protein
VPPSVASSGNPLTRSGLAAAQQQVEPISPISRRMIPMPSTLGPQTRIWMKKLRSSMPGRCRRRVQAVEQVCSQAALTHGGSPGRACHDYLWCPGL